MKKRRVMQIVKEVSKEDSEVKKFRDAGFAVKRVVGLGKRSESSEEMPEVEEKPSMNQLLAELFDFKSKFVVEKDSNSLGSEVVEVEKRVDEERLVKKEEEKRRFIAALRPALKEAGMEVKEAEHRAEIREAIKETYKKPEEVIEEVIPLRQRMLAELKEVHFG
jgi:hypothetical protein